MELTNEFEVPVPEDEAWVLLTDLARIAPCMPGATLTGVDGDEHQGTVKVKVGPITAQYKGTARIVERDDSTHTALLEASGKDTKGQGNASASIRAQLSGVGAQRTHVSLTTDLNISGKVAQFGRGALGDVSAKLLDQFVANLERDVLSGTDGNGSASSATPAASATGTTGTAATPVASAPPREAEPIDLLATAGTPIAKRLVPLVAAVGLVVVVLWVWRRRRRSRRA